MEDVEKKSEERPTVDSVSSSPAEAPTREGGREKTRDTVRPVKKRPKKPIKQSSSSEEVGYDDLYTSPLDSSSEVFFLGLFLVARASVCTRLYKIAEPHHVA